jgi:tetraacyldisaccharide 4'-kinase
MYDLNILRSQSFSDIKTICVGNLSVGGTGKSPHIEYIVRLLQNDFTLATLSRGYKRKTKGFLLADQNTSAMEIGDEPAMFKRKFDSLMVSVDANRIRGITKLKELSVAPEIVLLDDAFQHRKIKPGISILLTDYNKPFYNDFFLPSGRLRESKNNFLRADIIVVTRTPDSATNVDLRSVMKDIPIRAYQKIFFSYLKYGNLYQLKNNKEIIRPAMDLFRYSVLSVTGIAEPRQMNTFLKEYSDQLLAFPFGDHHYFDEKDILSIRDTFNRMDGKQKIIVTTEKDATRFLVSDVFEKISDLPIYVLPLEIDFKNKTEEFNDIILKYARSNKIHHQKYM